MKVLVLSVVLATFAIVSCKPRESASNSPAPTAESQINKVSRAEPGTNQPCLNLNDATAHELTNLPGVGDVIAKRIIEYRERHGRFRRREEIIIIEGFSERKYRAIAALVCVE